MGSYVHIHVCFACDTNDAVAALAAKHLPFVGECMEAQWFLEDLSKRTGENLGSKGGLSLWGMVGKYTNGEEFVEVLKPFWKELLQKVDGGPNSFEHILVFIEREQSEQATAFEIFLKDLDSPELLLVKKHDCPFTWMQM